MKNAPRLVRRLLDGQLGITGLETAIVLIAFIVVSLVFAFAALSTGLFSSDKAKDTIHGGLDETRGTLEVKGRLTLKATLTTSQTGISNGSDDTRYNLTAYPVQPSSGTITSGGTTELVLETDYIFTYDTSLLVLTSGTSGTTGDFIAVSTKYVIDSVDIQVASAAAGAEVNLTPGETMIIYQDDGDLYTNTNFGLTQIESWDNDNFMD